MLELLKNIGLGIFVNGNLKVVKTFLPTADPEIEWLYLMTDPCFTTNKLQLVNGKIYAGVTYGQNVALSDDVTLTGKVYADDEITWGMYMDVPSKALVSFDRDLTNPTVLYNVVSETSSAPQSFNFVIFFKFPICRLTKIFA